MHRNLFQRNETAELMVGTIFRYRDAGEFELHEYVIMPDHIHVLLTPKSGSSVQRAAQLIKGGFSHDVRQAGSSLNAIWQPRYHDRRIRDANEYAEIARYIRENPVRKGLVTAAADWLYSSAASISNLDEPPQGLKPQSYGELWDAGLKASSTENDSLNAGLKAGLTQELKNVLS
jgi:putative transposase